MAGNTIATGFVSLENLVSEVLMQIDDEESKKYKTKALQRIINTMRDVYVNMRNIYEEVAVTLDEDLRTGEYPIGLVKAISVGVYRNGEYWSFTHKPNMANTQTSDTEEYDEDFGENVNIPDRGKGFGARGRNFGYWTRDDKNCRFRVRNYTGNKVILRYRSNGITCTGDTCIPYDAKDIIVQKVVYDFARRGIPRRFSGVELQLERDEMQRVAENYFALQYEPQEFDELKDAEYASLNTTVRRD